MMTRLINEAPLHRREGARGSWCPLTPGHDKATPLPPQVTWPLWTLFSPQPVSLIPTHSQSAAGRAWDLSLRGCPQRPFSSAVPSIQAGGWGAECGWSGRRAARLPRHIQGNFRAITVPHRLPGTDCAARAESGNAQQALPGGGGEEIV